MFDLTRHPRLLKLLSLFDRGWAFLLRRNVRRREVESHLSAFYARMWKEAADSLGASLEDLGLGVFEIRLGDASTRVVQNSSSMDDLATFCVTRSKPVIYRLLNRHGLRTPRFAEFEIDNMRSAVALMESTRGDCVVKPGSGSGGGRGITTGIRTRWQLARAAYAASLFSDDLLIEEQIEGDNYRLLYLDGKLIDAVKRQPPSVIADGRSSLRRLVQAVNEERLARGPQVAHGLLTLDLDMKRTLAKQGYSFASVPPAGTVVTLKTAINENAGADNISAMDRLSEALIEEGARAAALARVRLAGVDIITRDPRVSLQESGGVILEVNTPPGYYWHYHKRDGIFPVAVHVLNHLLAPSPSRALCPS
jgi:D-alanine-D-alanine ligase-like ATP-grasp enzyme